MNSNILDTIKKLTLYDKKSLSQKALKTCEEVGELAKAVLPFDSAPTTSHKFIDKRKVLEEAIDTVICALSVAYDINASDEEIEAMFVEKCGKWSLLQNKDKSIISPVPYEAHVTVHTNEIERFKKVCKEIEVKAIVLDLKSKGGKQVFRDVMTSSQFVGNNREALEKINAIAAHLKKNGFDVVRQKIETVPWHPAAPSRDGHKRMPPNCYFECHFNVITHVDKRESLQQIAVQTGSHLSNNAFKILPENMIQIMLTTRVYDSIYEDFLAEVHNIKKKILDSGFTMEKEIIEFSIYDTKISHDAQWLSALDEIEHSEDDVD